MIMCQSFYVEEEEGEDEQGQRDEARSDAGSSHCYSGPDRRAPRTYLLSLIRAHPIWKEVRFW